MSFTGVLTRVWVKSSLQEHKLLKDSCIISRSSQVWVTTHKAGNLKHTASPIGISVRMSFPSALINLIFFQTTWLISASSRHLVWTWRLLSACFILEFSIQLSFLQSESNSQFWLFNMAGRSLVNPVSFRNFLKLSFFLPFYSRSFS